MEHDKTHQFGVQVTPLFHNLEENYLVRAKLNYHLKIQRPLVRCTVFTGLEIGENLAILKLPQKR